MDPIQQGLSRLFDRHRIVFWYDSAAAWKKESEGVKVEGVQVVRVDNDELNLKFRLLRDEPESMFLLYFPTDKPADEENWLLDILLANTEFHADRASLYGQQTGLPPEYKDLVEQHLDFFARKERRVALSARVESEDTHRQVRRRMIAIAIGAPDDALDSILLILCERLIGAELLDLVGDALSSFGLEEAFWQDVERQFGYQSQNPSLLDFILDVFRYNAPFDHGGRPDLGGQAVLFLSRWKDSSTYRPSFETLSARTAADLNVAGALNGVTDIAPLVDGDIDAYELVEQKIVHWLRDRLVDGSLKPDQRRTIVEKRTRSVWYSKYGDLYQAIDHAGEFLEIISVIDLSATSTAEAARFYTAHWWRVDYHYRRFHEYRRSAHQAGLLEPVEKAIEGHYVNNFLVPLATRWETLLDTETSWPPKGLSSQAGFFQEVVKPSAGDGQKLFVIISDALRYECAAELRQRLLREDRYQSDLEVRASGLPSFTQLGMASLLPHDKLELAKDGKSVKADGVSTVGSDNRLKILQEKSGLNCCLFKAEEFLKLNSKSEGRPLMKEHDLFYIYHNAIDAAGDDLKTEETVVSACEEALDTLVAVIKKVANINGTNMVVTSDHGFLFRQSRVEDSDCPKLPENPKYNAVTRRYALGNGIKSDHVLRRFTLDQIGLENGEFEVGIVKGVQRLPVKGSGKRYVHGGAMPQETLVPVLTVNKTRESDIRIVEVEIQAFPSKITTSQVAIRLYQKTPVSEVNKVIERELQIGLYTEEGEPLSDEQWAKFESTETDPRLREMSFNLTLGHKADAYNGKDIYLRLGEKIRGTSKMRIYQETSARLERHFASDFDEF